MQTNLELMLFPVNDDGSDLLVHEEEDGEQDRRHCRRDVHEPRSPFDHERNQPAPNVGPCRLKFNFINGNGS